jgi:hypothetical protein
MQRRYRGVDMFFKCNRTSYVIETTRSDEQIPDEVKKFISDNDIPFRFSGFNDGPHEIVNMTKEQYRNIRPILKKYNLTIRKGLI